MLSQRLRELREMSGLPQRKVASALDLDTATYCKIENGMYIPKKNQVIELANIFDVEEDELLKLWMAARIQVVAEDDKLLAKDALKIVEEKLNKDTYEI